MTRSTPDDRSDDGGEPESKNDLGYSLPDESNASPITRGSLVARSSATSGGNSPTRVMIYTEEIAYPQGSPFAEVVEGLDVLESILKGETDSDRPDRLKSVVKIESAKVEGSVDHPPTGKALPRFTPAALPKGAATTETPPKTESQSKPGTPESQGK
ncbi:MAG: hypothetical protein H7062_24500 [Candidatus Saccharimonas sp.]|nr:hypothetical protein [Planctomycetaceae bacterium]